MTRECRIPPPSLDGATAKTVIIVVTVIARRPQRAMASSEYLRGHDFYALARRASAPGSANVSAPTGFLNYDAWMLEGLETIDANVRALGVMLTSTDEELDALDSRLTTVIGYTDGRGRVRPGFRSHGLHGLELDAAANVERRVRAYAGKLSSASSLREPMSDFMSSSCRMFNEEFLSHLETIDHNLRAWFLATAPEATTRLVRVPARAASPPRVRVWDAWHLNAIEIVNANIVDFARAFCPDVDVAPPRASTEAGAVCCALQ